MRFMPYEPLTESERAKVSEINKLGRQVTFEEFNGKNPEKRWCCSCAKAGYTFNGWGPIREAAIDKALHWVRLEELHDES